LRFLLIFATFGGDSTEWFALSLFIEAAAISRADFLEDILNGLV
jgi:hypothetical protein